MSLFMKLTVPLKELPLLTCDEAKRKIREIDDERKANATPGNPDACGEGFRYYGPNPCFLTTATTLDGQDVPILAQIAWFMHGGDIAYNVYGVVVDSIVETK